VSFYAFFKRWLLPGLLPVKFYQKNFNFNLIFINFNIRSGLFPSRLSTFALKVCLIEMSACIRRFLIKIKIAQSQTNLLHHLYVHRFRRKPAITKFDKSFTPNYNSSQNFATSTSSVLLGTNFNNK